MYARVGKRPIDLVLGTVLLLVAAPVMAVVYVLVRATSRGPVLFTQERLGRDGEVFRLLKFRTMVHRERTPSTVAVAAADPDITAVGRFLRRFKLDELPQIWNVVAGDMSLIGPRPQLPVQLAELNEDGKVRLAVRPGLTGMAQTHGNTLLTWPERWHYDAYYVRHLSFRLDCSIVWRTIFVLAFGEERYLEHPFPGGKAYADA